jgi:transcriptional regulator with XRE-family HTH domain
MRARVRYPEHMAEIEPFGVRLRRLRGEQKMGLRELARRSRVNVSTVSETERGVIWAHGYPPLEQVRAYADALGVPLGVLAPALGDPPGEPPDGPRPDRPRLGPDAAYNRGVIVEYVEAWPDPIFHERLMREKEARTPESYARFCLRTFALWTANFNGVLETAEEMRGEVYDEPGSPGDEGARS